MRLLVDTNAWLRCAALRIDVWAEAKRIVPGRVQVCVIDKVVHELQGLQAAGGTLARNAKLAHELLKQKDTVIVPTHEAGNADDVLVAIASEPDFVLTQDRELKRRLKAKGAGIVVIRQDNHLELENRY